ncbi:MAG: aminotransferase class V-fold PLP-dependent enzyme, partial [Deltaproteobacteria bacterium]|nr:aminotransferase class V-fold PLP-dependent enzyme [Deltaproteobacteria bacterium]
MNNSIYLDNAATTYPKPESVYIAMDRFFRELGANPGRSGHSMAVKAEEMIDNTRLAAAKFFNIGDHRRVVFTLNATDGLNMGIKGALKQGDHAITSHLEHNSVSRPLEGLSRAGVIEYDRARNDADGFIDPDDVRRLIRKNTRMIVITHVSNSFGAIQPVKEISEIARERGIIFFLDASQSAGLVPLDIGGSCIDMFACPGH